MLHEHRGLETARILLHASSVSEGYVALWERKRLDLTVEEAQSGEAGLAVRSPQPRSVLQVGRAPPDNSGSLMADWRGVEGLSLFLVCLKCRVTADGGAQRLRSITGVMPFGAQTGPVNSLFCMCTGIVFA